MQVDIKSLEFNDIANASIFSVPKVDSTKQMKILQNLWTKRHSQDLDPRRQSQGSEQSTLERSFFESDSEDEDGEDSKRR